MLRHFVALRFRKDTDAETKAALMRDLSNLDQVIDGIVDFQSRENVSVETPLVRDFLDVFWFDFRDTDVRDIYLEDPTHQAIGARIVEQTEGGIDGVFVFDFEI